MQSRKDDNFTGTISMSRGSDGTMNIRIRDSDSRTEFVDVRMSMEDFAGCITGLAELDVMGEVRGLDRVGKTKVQEPRQALYPGVCHDRVLLSNWLKDEKLEDGWIISTYLGSQSSVSVTNDGTLLRYTATKYITKEV